MKIQKIPVDEINFAAYNPRDASAKFITALRKSLQRYGLTDPLVYNARTKTLIGGHQRARQLIAAGAQELECVIHDFDLDNEQALNLALNKIRLGTQKPRSEGAGRRESAPQDGKVQFAVWLDQEQHAAFIEALEVLNEDYDNDADAILAAARWYRDHVAST